MAQAQQRAVGVAVIGWGNFFSHVHAQTLQQAAQEGRARLVAVCELDANKQQEIAAAAAPGYLTDDLNRILQDEAVEAVLIAAPQAVQATASLAALGAGKYVYCEKPFFADAADTGQDPEALQAALLQLGAAGRDRLRIGFNKRFAPGCQDLRRHALAHGGVRSLQMNIIDDAWRWGSRYPAGFLLWLDLCHWLDLACFLTDSDITALSCLQPQANDHLLSLTMGDGAAVQILLSGNGSMDMLKEELQVITSQRRCARLSDYLQLEIFGGEQAELRRYPAQLQLGGDAGLVQAIDAGGVPAFGEIRRRMLDIRQASERGERPAPPDYRCNLPNFMRPQGWREAVDDFLQAAAEARPLRGGASWQEAWQCYRLLATVAASLKQAGALVPYSG